MEPDFPSNSHRRQAKNEEPDSKKVERITSGDAVRRKKPLGKRFKEIFAGGNLNHAMGYVFMGVLLPAAKDMIADAGSTFIEKMLFGESHSTSRRSGYRPGSVGHTNYQSRYSPNTPRDGRRDEPRNMSRKARSTHDFDEIILSTRVEAEEVIDRLFDLISKFEVASVSDLYDLVGINGDYTDRAWGWMDIRGADVVRVRNGYLLDLPKPEPID